RLRRLLNRARARWHLYTTTDVRGSEVVGTFTVRDGSGPHAGVVALSGSGGGVPSWWGDLLAPHGVGVLSAASSGVGPLPSALCEIPVEIVAAAGDWLRRQPQLRGGHVGLVGARRAPSWRCLQRRVRRRDTPTSRFCHRQVAGKVVL